MSTGFQTALMPAANTMTLLYASPPGITSTMTFNCVNTDPSAAGAVTLFAVPRAEVGVTSLAITNPGAGYTAVPAVTISGGGGTGAAATVTMEANTVAIAAAGANYAVGNTLTVVQANTTPLTLTVSSIDALGGITGVTIANRGEFNAISNANLAVTGGAGSGAQFTVNWRLKNVTLTAPGSNYHSEPTVTVPSGSAAATLTATVGASPVARHRIESATNLIAGGVLERTGIIMGQGDRVFVQCSVATIACTEWGVKSTAAT